MPLESGALLNGRYRVERTLGQGGFGAVYLATDENLGLTCAVKENLNFSAETERQFRREATLLATLRHPNLPRVTNHFILDDQQYLVMDFVEGDDLRHVAEREGALPQAEVLRWAGAICEAVAYLHEHDPPVIHRDIKPANLKVTPEGEVMLVDFGIAKLGAAGQKTATGATGLTSGFAPPEQYGFGRTDARTDVYALGATFYNLLTGQLPPDSVERLIGQAVLTPPEGLRSDLAPHVAAAIRRAMEIKPDDRFSSMREFQAALADPGFTYAPPEPAVEPAPAPAEAAAAPRRAPRPRSAPGSGCLLLLSIVVLAAAVFSAWGDPERLGQQLRASFIPTRAPSLTPARASATAPAAQERPSATPPVVIAGASATPAPTATPAPRLTPTPTLAPVAASAGNAAAWRRYSSWQRGDASVLFAPSQDGQTLALLNEQGVDIFDLVSGEIVQRAQGFIVNRQVIGLGYLPGALMVQLPDEIWRWDIERNGLIQRYSLPGSEMGLSPDRRRMVVRDKYLSVIDLDTGRLLKTLGNDNTRQVYAFSPDGAYFALSVGNDAEVWNLDTGQLVRTLFGHGEPVTGLAFSADGSRLVSAGGDVWDTALGSLLAVFDSSTEMVAVSPDGQVIVGADGSVWRLEDGALIGQAWPEASGVRRMQFTPDGRFLVWQAQRGPIEVWTVDPAEAARLAAITPTAVVRAQREPASALNPSRLRRLEALGSGGYQGVALSPDGVSLAAWSSRQVTVLDVASGEVLAEFQAGSVISDAAYLGDAFLLTLGTRGGVERWEIATRRLKQSYDVPGRRIVASHDLFAVQDKYIQVIESVTGRLRHNLGSADSGQDFIFTPDGQYLAIAAGTGVGLWDMQTGRQALQFGGHGARTRGLGFTPDGGRLVSAGGDVWDVQTGDLLAAFEAGSPAIALDPSGRLAVGGDGGLWDGRTGQYVGDLDFNAARLLFTPDGQRLVLHNPGGLPEVYGIEPAAAHRSPPASTAQPPGLQALTPEQLRAAPLDLLGWWGEDPLLDIRLRRDRPGTLALQGGTRTYLDLAPSPDDKTVTALSADGIDLLDPATGAVVDEYRIFLNPDTLRQVAYAGESLLLLKGQAGVERWNLETQALEQRYFVTGDNLAVSPDGQRFALYRDGQVWVVETASGEVSARLRAGPGPQEYAFSPDGQSLALVNGPVVEVWDLSTGKRAQTLRGHAARLNGLVYLPGGSQLAAASGDVWDLATGKLLQQFAGQAARLAADPAGGLLAGDDGALWEAATGQRVGSLLDLRTPARQVLFSADGKQLLWLADDGRLYTWGALAQPPRVTPPAPAADAITAANAPQLQLLAHIGRGRLLSALWSPDEAYLAVNTSQNAVLYAGDSLERRRAFLDVTALAFNAQGQVLLGGRQPLQLVDVASGEVVRDFGQAGILAAAFSPDGKLLAIGGQVAQDGKGDGLAVIELSDGLVRVLERGAGVYKEITGLAFSPDSRRLAASFPGKISLWNLETNAMVRGAIGGNTRPAVVSPDGKYIAYFTNRFVVESLDQGGAYRTISADGTPFFPTGIDLPRYAPMEYTFTSAGRLLVFYQKINRRTNQADVALAEWNIDDGTARVMVDSLFNLDQVQGFYLDAYAADRARRTPAFGLSPAGNLLYSLTGDGVARVWSYPDGGRQAESDSDYLDVMALSPDGATLVLANALGGLELFDIGAAQRTRVIPGAWYPVRLAFDSASVLMIWQADGTLTFLDLETGQAVEAYSGDFYLNTDYLAVGPDGRLFAQWQRSLSRDLLNVFSLMPGRPLHALGRFPRPGPVIFSPDGLRLAAARGGQVELWSMETAQVEGVLEAQSNTVGRLAFASDGLRLASATGEIWDVEQAALLAAFDSSAGRIALSPNDEVIAGDDGTLWALASGQPIDALRGLRGPAQELLFTADGRRLIWRNVQGIIEIWGLP